MVAGGNAGGNGGGGGGGGSSDPSTRSGLRVRYYFEVRVREALSLTAHHSSPPPTLSCQIPAESSNPQG